MGNERLRSAMDHVEVTIEGLAREVEVDPKTVQRWLAGRVPHARHRWSVAERVNEDEEFLWPGARRRPTDALGSIAELVGAYAYRSDVESSRWWTLITGAKTQIDLMGYTLYFLPEQHADLVRVLSQKCAEGCRIRLLVASPESDTMHHRELEERAPITLSARLEASLLAFQPLLQCEHAELRYQDVPLYNSVFRFDDQMFVTPHLYAMPGNKAPLLHLRRLSPGGLFDRFVEHFEAIWAASDPG